MLATVKQISVVKFKSIRGLAWSSLVHLVLIVMGYLYLWMIR